MIRRLLLVCAFVLALPSVGVGQVITPGGGYPDSWELQLYAYPLTPCTITDPATGIVSLGPSPCRLQSLHLYLGEGMGVYNNPSNTSLPAHCGINGPAPIFTPDPRNPDVVIWTDPVDASKYCWAGIPSLPFIAGMDGTYVFTLAEIIGSVTGMASPPSNPFTAIVPLQPSIPIIIPAPSSPPPTPPDPALCVPPLGSQSIAMFITAWSATTGKPGSRSHVDFQIASVSAITKLTARLGGVDVASGAGSDVGSLWFTTPTSGTYALTVYAENAYGCIRETMSPRSVVVP